MNGILVVDKPAGFTSFDVVAKLRGICATRKIGHGGTLDPMATGVLPVFIGNAAKAVDLQPRQDKTYEAEILFGIATDTGDITGEVLRQEENAQVTAEQLQLLLPRFEGAHQQLPPLYSAVKVNGKPLYRYAREGKQVQRTPRPVTIHSLRYLGQAASNRHRVEVHCSKGTYVRTLAEELGEALGTPATLAALRRTAAGVFSLQDAHTLQEIQAAKDQGRLSALVLDTGVVFAPLPALALAAPAAQRLYNGAAVYGIKEQPGRYRVLLDGRFLGLAVVDEQGVLQAEKMLAAQE